MTGRSKRLLWPVKSRSSTYNTNIRQFWFDWTTKRSPRSLTSYTPSILWPQDFKNFLYNVSGTIITQPFVSDEVLVTTGKLCLRMIWKQWPASMGAATTVWWLTTLVEKIPNILKRIFRRYRLIRSHRSRDLYKIAGYQLFYLRGSCIFAYTITFNGATRTLPSTGWPIDVAFRHRYILCTGIGNGARRSICIIGTAWCVLWSLWPHEMTLPDFSPPRSMSRLYETMVTNVIQFLIVLFCCTSKLVSRGSFGWLTFSGLAYLSWKGKATYVDGAYSEGKSL